MIFARYVLIVSGPDSYPAGEGSSQEWEQLEQEARNALHGRALGDAEDVINDHLPDGYSVKFAEVGQ